MTASWVQIARKDFEDVLRAKIIWGIVAIIVLIGLFVMSFEVLSDDPVDADAFFLELTHIMGGVFLALIALIGSYMAIVGEERSGSLRVLLSYPFSRFDVVFGKLVGRALAIGLSFLVGMVILIGIATLVLGPPPLRLVLGVPALFLLYGFVFTGIGIGASAAFRTRGKAMAAVFGIFLLFIAIWTELVVLFYRVVAGSAVDVEAEGWYFLLHRISPFESFGHLSRVLFGYQPLGVHEGWPEQLPEDIHPEQLELASRVAGELPFYLQDWFVLLVLLAWGILPVIVGYFRFQRADLG